jgi:hypothetical protein
MATIQIDQIGKYNKQLVLDLLAGNSASSDAPIEEWRHTQSYNYDLSFGVAAIHAKRMLPGTKVGVKYYCATRDFEWDMKRRIVHVYDRLNANVRSEFYLLTHSDGPVRDNSYSMCQTIVY